MLAPTNGLARVRAYYSESYTYDIFTVRWRPGAFPPQLAERVAAMAREALDYNNALLGVTGGKPMEIFLADTLFNADCVGCQGFAAADLRQVFVLYDGSIPDAELRVLLVHEIGHMLAYDVMAEPNNLFFAEGWATYTTNEWMQQAGNIAPRQTAAWALQAGALPSLDQLRNAKFAGRMRARVEYDGAESFTQFMIETYGMATYRNLYVAYMAQAASPERLALEVIGKDWAALEAEWRAWLGQWAGNVIGGVDGATWWSVFARIGDGYSRLYADPASVSAAQYSELTRSRLALNRGDLQTAVAAINASDLVTGAAN